ncbi:hypothetical protein [Yinghuangia sp. YIM S10712]
MPFTAADAFARPYMAIWNEPDADARRTAVTVNQGFGHQSA